MVKSNTSERLKNIDSLVANALVHVGATFAELVRAALVAKGKVATGALMESISVSPPMVRDGKVVVLVGSDLSYAERVHQGTPPGQPAPDIGAIMKWMAAKGINPMGEPERVAGMISRAIARRGIPGVPYMSETFKESKDALQEQLRRELAEVARKI